MAGTFATAKMASTSTAEIDPSTATTRTEEPLVSPTSAKMAITVAATEMAITFAAAEMAGTSAAEMEKPLLRSQYEGAAPLHLLLCCRRHRRDGGWRSRCSATSATSPPPPLQAPLRSPCLFFSSFFVYMLVGVLFYCINSQDFFGVQTNRIIDGLYYCIITFYTVGYGDIVPITPATKVFCCIFVLIGVGPINIMISDAIDYIVDIILDYIAI